MFCYYLFKKLYNFVVNGIFHAQNQISIICQNFLDIHIRPLKPSKHKAHVLYHARRKTLLQVNLFFIDIIIYI